MKELTESEIEERLTEIKAKLYDIDHDLAATRVEKARKGDSQFIRNRLARLKANRKPLQQEMRQLLSELRKLNKSQADYWLGQFCH